jgi:hypothetical protein
MSSESRGQGDGAPTEAPQPVNNTVSETTLLSPSATYFADEKIQIPEADTVRPPRSIGQGDSANSVEFQFQEVVGVHGSRVFDVDRVPRPGEHRE